MSRIILIYYIDNYKYQYNIINRQTIKDNKNVFNNLNIKKLWGTTSMFKLKLYDKIMCQTLGNFTETFGKMMHECM